MAKNPETSDPFHEEHHDDQTFLYGKDKMHAYIPPDQIPDTSESEIEDGEQDSDEVPDYHEVQFRQEMNDVMQSLEADKRAEQLKREILTFHQGEGVVSVYTEAVEQKKVPYVWQAKKPQKEDEFPGVERENISKVSRRKTDEPITSLSAEQVTRKSREYDKTRKEIRSRKRLGNTGEEHDNLKTIKKSLGKNGRPKIERSFRQKIRDFFTRQVYKETPTLRREEEWDSAEDLREVPDEVILNGKPIDKRFLDQEDKAA